MLFEPKCATARPAVPGAGDLPLDDGPSTGVVSTSRMALSLISLTSTCIANPIVQPLSS